MYMDTFRHICLLTTLTLWGHGHIYKSVQTHDVTESGDKDIQKFLQISNRQLHSYRTRADSESLVWTFSVLSVVAAKNKCTSNLPVTVILGLTEVVSVTEYVFKNHWAQTGKILRLIMHVLLIV